MTTSPSEVGPWGFLFIAVAMPLMGSGLYQAWKHNKWRKAYELDWSEKSESPIGYWIYVVACIFVLAVGTYLIGAAIIRWMR